MHSHRSNRLPKQGDNRLTWILAVAGLAACVVLALTLGLYFGLRGESTKNIVVDGQLDISLPFTEEYTDRTSASFQQLEENFCTEMDSLYEGRVIENCTITSVIEGSISCRFTITFKTSLTQEQEVFIQETLSELQAVSQGNKPDVFQELPIKQNSIVLSITSDIATGQQCKTSSVCSGADAEEAIESVFPSKDTNECDANPCSRGICSNNDGGFICYCNGTGYMGNVCDEDINECENPPTPCLNGGVCNNNNGSFTCDCTNTGYTGDICSNDINECDGNPCNTGICSNTDGGFVCHCNGTGYAGDVCDQDIDECDGHSSPCLNGGECDNNNGSFTCDCTDTGYTGDICSTDINECDGNPCSAGICSNTVGGFVCHCSGTGYTGDICDQDINECDSNPSSCLNGGQCNNNNGSFTCDCTDTGYTGDICSTDINECDGNPCSAGICSNTVGGFVCHCNGTGYTGDICDQDINECDSHPSPCLNGGECDNNNGSFTCNCTNTGYTGDFCSTDHDECQESDPCVNGTCLNTVGSYKCVCHDGFTGDICDEDINECENDPCLNNAVCTNEVGSFSCNCTGTGYMGDTCGNATCTFREIHSCPPVTNLKSVCTNVRNMNPVMDAAECFTDACNEPGVNTFNFVHSTTTCYLLSCGESLQLEDTTDNTEIYIRQPFYIDPEPAPVD